MGTLLQFGGLAIMPFALLVLSGEARGPAWIGQIGAALAFLLVGAGLHTTQTAGLALATDLAPATRRPRVVALLYVMLLVGMVASALVFGALLADFSQIKLIQVIQGAALADDGAQRRGAVEAGARDPAGATIATRRAADSSQRLAAFGGGARHAALLVASASAPPPSACRTSCSNPMAARSWPRVGRHHLLTAILAGGTLIALALAAALAVAASIPIRSPRTRHAGRHRRVRLRDLRRAARARPGCCSRSARR
jgi:BCD family chlorophyll transporter-like MFS transporter